MPLIIKKEHFEKAGGYPDGNRILDDRHTISGDAIFFYERLKSIGVEHYTAFDVLFYHIIEGETDE